MRGSCAERVGWVRAGWTTTSLSRGSSFEEDPRSPRGCGAGSEAAFACAASGADPAAKGSRKKSSRAFKAACAASASSAALTAKPARPARPAKAAVPEAVHQASRMIATQLVANAAAEAAKPSTSATHRKMLCRGLVVCTVCVLLAQAAHAVRAVDPAFGESFRFSTTEPQPLRPVP